MSSGGWQAVEDIQLLVGISHHETQLGCIGTVEANGEARRVMVTIVDTDEPRDVLARWRTGVPSSVRVLAANRFRPDQRTIIERQLVAYVAGRRGARLEGMEVAVELAVEPQAPEITDH